MVAILNRQSHGSTRRHAGVVRIGSAKRMESFIVGQKWIMADAVYGTFFGEVIEVSDEGASGIVIITDEQENITDKFVGSAATFQASGEWQLIQR